MRKNLLLLIMFCLIATIGAKATVTSAVVSGNGKTLTITQDKAGGLFAYFIDKGYLDASSAYTTLIVKGPISKGDIEAAAAMPALTSLDLKDAKVTDGWNLKFKEINDKVQYSVDNKSYQYDNHFPTQLEAIYFPKSTITAIPDDCMQNWTHITKVGIPYGYKTIGANAFNKCTSLRILNLPEGITEIGSYAFQNSAIQSVRLPNSLETIGSFAFMNCENLRSIVIPKGVKRIKQEAFNTCHNLKDVYVLATTPPILEAEAFSLLQTHGSGGGYPQGYLVTDDNYTMDEFKADSSAKKKEGITITINRNTYWNEGETNKMTLLHYPKEAIDDTNNKSLYSDEDLKNSTYTLYGPDTRIVNGKEEKVKYPNRTEGENLYSKWIKLRTADTEVQNVNDMHWQEFVLAGEIKGDEIIPIPNIVASRWYTMCFDFPMTKGQIESAFGDGTEVCRFQGVKYKKDEKNNVTATLDFTKDMYDATDATTAADEPITEAGHPYMIHPAAETSTVEYDANNPIYYITGVTKVSCKAEDHYDYGEVFGTSKSDVDNYYPYGSYIFKGKLSADEETVPVGNYFLSRDKSKIDETEDGHRAFYYNVNGNYNWTQYAATLYEDHSKENYHGKTTNAGAKTCVAFGNDAVIFTSDNSTTGIENTESENSNETSVKFADKVFSISGQLVRTGSSSLDGLAKGMYIVNGKKYIVK